MSFRSALAALILILPAQAFASYGPPPVRIAVIDSGVAMTELLDGSVEAEYDMAGDREPFSTASSHGTSMTSILVKSAHVPVSIVSLRVDDPRRPCAEREPCRIAIQPILAAIEAAIDLRVDIISYSLDTPYTQELADLLGTASDAGITIVMAAGNVPQEPNNLRYAQYVGPRVWIVGSVDQAGRPAHFSGRPSGPCACRFVWRPGVDIETQDIHGNPVRESGTSVSVPLMVAELADRAVQRRMASAR